MYPEISEDERFPIVSPQGRQWLRSMRQHARAPIWNWPNGEQLDAAGLAQVQAFAANLENSSPQPPHAYPDWLANFVDYCLTEVPFYRSRAKAGTPLTSIPSCSRRDLAPQVWWFVPDSQPLEDLVVFSSSGTTGLPTRTPAHPASAACGIPLLEKALTSLGVRFPRGCEQMALTNIASYRGVYTTAIVVSYLAEAGCIRVNLHPEPWRQPEDRAAYLDEFWAPVMLGDPVAFAALDKVPIERPPQVLLSCIMELSDAFAAKLRVRYGCEVLDLYALTEAGIIAMKQPAGHVILPHDLYVEILDEHDQPCSAGTPGEITLTGGRNPYLPLLRYRTGDTAALSWIDGQPTLIGLQGRQPVSFPIGDRVVHSMEVTRALRPFPLAQFQLQQDQAGDFQFRYRGSVDELELRDALRSLLGSKAQLTMSEMPMAAATAPKLIVYHSDHPAASRLGL